MQRRNAKCLLQHVVKRSDQTEYTRHHNGDTDDIIDTIMYADARSADFVKDVSCFWRADLYESLYQVWKALRTQLKYRADKPGHERVKSPGALVTSGVGDCKSFSIMVGAILRKMGIPYVYRFTAYAPGDYTHVYVVAKTPDGPVIIDAVHTKYDEEVRYMKKKDIAPPQSRVSGMHGASNHNTNSVFIWALVLFGAVQLYRAK